jgi:hypothetical protein
MPRRTGERTRRWRSSKTIRARRLHTTQHVGIAIEIIVGVMAFALANAVLISVEDLHVGILLRMNESIERERDPAPKVLELLQRNEKGFSSSWTLKSSSFPTLLPETTKPASPLLLPCLS